MPELPEVEHLRRTLVPVLVGAGVESVTLLRADIALATGARGRTRPARARDLLLGGEIASLERHGKQLAILAADGRVLVVHLGMTGSLRIAGSGPEPDKHVHVRWMLSGGRELRFRDPRRFGRLTALAGRDALDRRWSAMGTDALRVSAPGLRHQLGASRRAIKAALLDQRALAGVGNIYADEALFEARINPRRACSDLSEPEWTALAAAIRHILARAVRAGGSTLRDYVDAAGNPGRYVKRHAVYGRAGQACVRCAGALHGEMVGQRTTVWCPRCQPPGPGGGALSTGRGRNSD